MNDRTIKKNEGGNIYNGRKLGNLLPFVEFCNTDSHSFPQRKTIE